MASVFQLSRWSELLFPFLLLRDLRPLTYTCHTLKTQFSKHIQKGGKPECVILLVGGCADAQTIENSIYAYHLYDTKIGWKKHTRTLPSPRCFHGCVYDTKKEDVYVVGGFSVGCGIYGDVWGTNQGLLEAMQNTESPSNKHSSQTLHTISYNKSRKKVESVPFTSGSVFLDAIYIRGFVYSVGGVAWATCHIDDYDSRRSELLSLSCHAPPLPPMLYERSGVCACVLNDRYIVCIGGHRQFCGERMSSVEIFDLDSWLAAQEEIKNRDSGDSSSNSGSSGDDSGDSNGSSSSSGSNTDEEKAEKEKGRKKFLESLLLRRNKYYDRKPILYWKEIASLDFPLSGGVAVGIKNNVFLMGGLEQRARHELVSGRFRQYNYTSNTWSELPPLCTPRCFATAVCSNNTIYVMGGMDDHSQMLDSVEKYDFEVGHWEYVSAMRLPKPLVGTRAVLLPDC